jgi:hypothetical protein
MRCFQCGWGHQSAALLLPPPLLLLLLLRAQLPTGRSTCCLLR